MQLTRETKFDYQTHAKNFINYLEVVILPDGKIEYCVPSHQEKLIELYMKKYNVSREKLMKIIPISEDVISWLVNELGVSAVWYNFVISPWNKTIQQKQAVYRLLRTGCLYKDYEEVYVVKNKYDKLFNIPNEVKRYKMPDEKDHLNKIIENLNYLEEDVQSHNWDFNSTSDIPLSLTVQDLVLLNKVVHCYAHEPYESLYNITDDGYNGEEIWKLSYKRRNRI